MIKRTLLFLLTNIAIMVVISITLSLVFSFFNIDPYLSAYGINLKSLILFATAFGFAGSIGSLFLSKWMAKRAYKIEIIESPKTSEEIFVVQTVQRLAERAGIGMPEVGIYNSPEVNAFATGARKNSSLVAVSSGLLANMEQNEAEGVLAHEVSHIANGDMVTMALMQGVINTFVIIFARIAAYAVQTFLNRGNNNESIGGLAYYGTSILFEIFFGILASTIVMWFSRHREYRADAGSADLLGSPQKMILALQRLQALKETVPIDPRGKSMRTMKINDKSAFMAMFSTHPALEDRIQALQKGGF